MCSIRQCISQTMVIIVGLYVCAPVAFADDPPEFKGFDFDEGLQELTFGWFSGGRNKKNDWGLSSSTKNTVFSKGDDEDVTGHKTGSSTGSDGYAEFIGITPGVDPVGTVVRFTVTVTNDNAARARGPICLVVVAGRLGTGGFAESETCGPHIPTLPEWGLIVMTLLLLVAGTILFFRKRARETTVA